MAGLLEDMVIPDDVLAKTARRFQERAAERSATERKIDKAKAGQASVLSVDSPDRVALRRERLATHQPSLRPMEPPVAVDVPADEAEPGLERVLEGNNLVGVSFLELGSRAAATVARVNVRSKNRLEGFGTGSLISDRLLMTNNHVLSTSAEAEFSTAEFDFQDELDGGARPSFSFALRPDELFLTSKALDVTIVAVAPTSRPQDGEERALATYGFNVLNREQGKVLLGECINIVQHPEGRPKQLALQQNELIDRFDDFLHYRTDTSPGSSGSPLFNNQWEVLGIHHSGVPAEDDDGRILSVDGTPWDRSMGEDKIKWIANEGIRISSIVAWLEEQARDLSAAQQALITPVTAPTDEVRTLAAGTAVRPVAASVAGSVNGTGHDVTVTVPLQITVRLG